MNFSPQTLYQTAQNILQSSQVYMNLKISNITQPDDPGDPQVLQLLGRFTAHCGLDLDTALAIYRGGRNCFHYKLFRKSVADEKVKQCITVLSLWLPAAVIGYSLIGLITLSHTFQSRDPLAIALPGVNLQTLCERTDLQTTMVSRLTIVHYILFI
ncbi:hypothetical protein PoB_006124200 [Plakobranchus ocellatus]|uniref:Uncharacterized protein n=1 Tax=Plakobranchus ocellatus TaxID=259542 RepID=A0AAV4CS66_9GAST|nr:hypothetical protein PoB_006124200 [Plakobranchus ocellatus]